MLATGRVLEKECKERYRREDWRNKRELEKVRERAREEWWKQIRDTEEIEREGEHGR